MKQLEKKLQEKKWFGVEKHVEKMEKRCEHSFSGPQRLEGNDRYCEKRNGEKENNIMPKVT